MMTLLEVEMMMMLWEKTESNSQYQVIRCRRWTEVVTPDGSMEELLFDSLTIDYSVNREQV